MKKYLSILALFLTITVIAQNETRHPIKGQVLYRSVNVINEHVINTTSLESTTTDEQGRFIIDVKEGDELIFTAVNYQIEVLVITQEIIANNRIVIEVIEKVNELDEVVVTPENREKFLQLKNEEFKSYVYEIDRSTRVDNIALSQSERGMVNGLNMVNVFKAIFDGDKKQADKESSIQLSDVLRSVYDDSFFVRDLMIPSDQIGAFLLYCDVHITSRALLKKSNEFELIEFLVVQSQNFMKQ